MNWKNERKNRSIGVSNEIDRENAKKVADIYHSKATLDENNNKTSTDKKNRWNFTTAQISMYDRIMSFNLLFADSELANERE